MIGCDEHDPSLTAICAGCHGYITDNTARDNRYRGCSLCSWVMHHHCWIERLPHGLPCFPEHYESEADEATGRVLHGDVVGMRGEWGPLA